MSTAIDDSSATYNGDSFDGPYSDTLLVAITTRMADNVGVTRISNSPEETMAIANEVAATLRGGECIALHGDLGAGKTQFVRGLVRGLGGDGRSVSSPTYVLLNIYPSGRLTVFHLDAYRVGGAEDFEGIGFSELLEQGGVVVVEWASRVADLLPTNHLSISIEAAGPTQRTIAL